MRRRHPEQETVLRQSGRGVLHQTGPEARRPPFTSEQAFPLGSAPAVGIKEAFTHIRPFCSGWYIAA